MVIFELNSTVSLLLTLDREGIGGVTGQNPTVAIRQATSTDTYLDFATQTFLSSGWTTKYSTMTEIERGHYIQTVDLTVGGPFSAGQILHAEFHVDDGGAIVGDTSETIVLVEEINSLGLTTTQITQLNTLAAGGGFMTPEQAAQLEAIFQILGLDPAEPLTVSKTSRTAGTAITQKIEENVPAAGSVKVTRT